jgi:hypothetical protein
MSLPQCSRSKDIIEPMLKPQWWVNCQGMAEEACAAVRDGRLQILPQEFEVVWFRCFPLLFSLRMSQFFGSFNALLARGMKAERSCVCIRGDLANV